MSKSILVVGILLSSIIYHLASAPIAYAQDAWSGTCVVGDVPTLGGIQCLIGNILSVALQFLGIIFFVMLLFGGFKYLISGGDPKATEGAKGTITAAIGGLVLAILAWFILRLIQDITGVKVTQFTWPSL